MGRKLHVLLGAVVALGLAAVASGAGTPGVTSTEVLIGGTTPLSGPASAYQSVARGRRGVLQVRQRARAA